MPCARSSAAVPGPIAAIRLPARARASPGSASKNSRTPFGLVKQIRSWVGVRQLDRERLDPDRGRLDHLGAERAQPLGEPARLGARPRDRHHLPVQRAPLEPRERLAQPRHRPHERDRRRPHARLGHPLGDLGERAGHRALPRQRAARHDRGGLSPGRPAADQALGDQRQVLDAHVEDERAREARQRVPVERRLRPWTGPRARSRTPPPRRRRGGSPGCRRRRARPPPRSRRARPRTRRRLRASSSASSPPRPNTNGSPPLSRTTLRPAWPSSTSSAVEVVLLDRRAAGLLAHVAQLRVGARAVERAGWDQAVVEHHVGR